jgi:Tol biopolymer transport system component
VNKLGALLVLGISLLASGQQGSSQASTRVAGYKIRKLAFEVIRENPPFRQTDIFVIAYPNTKPKRLVEGTNPAWSPDGERVAYCGREGRGVWQIQLVNADGSGQTQLTKLKGGACGSDWSPDGEKMVFTAPGAKGSAIFVMGKDGGNVTEITVGYGARWSPDGKRLLFCRNAESRRDSGSIWIANWDGSGATKVIEDNSNVLEATWFPDGKSIAFSSTREHKNMSAIFRVNVDGSGLEPVAVDREFGLYFPVFSPDALQLVTDGFTDHPDDGGVLLRDLTSHHTSVLAHGIHPSVLWEKR